MEERYIAFISNAEEKGQLEIRIIDQRITAVIHKFVCARDLLDVIKSTLSTYYGYRKVGFVELMDEEV